MVQYDSHVRYKFDLDNQTITKERKISSFSILVLLWDWLSSVSFYGLVFGESSWPQHSSALHILATGYFNHSAADQTVCSVLVPQVDFFFFSTIQCSDLRDIEQLCCNDSC